MFGISTSPSTLSAIHHNADQGLITSHLSSITAPDDAQPGRSFSVLSDLRTSPSQIEGSPKNNPGILKPEPLTENLSTTSQLSSLCTTSDSWASRTAPLCSRSDHFSHLEIIKSTAVTNSAAVQHSPQSFQGKGDQRFPPGRPPSKNDRSIEAGIPFQWSSVNLSAKLNRWARPVARRSDTEQSEDSASAACQTQVSPPVSATLLRPRSFHAAPLEGYKTGTPAQRQSFFDPEHEVNKLADIKLTKLADIPTRPRYLTNGEANRQGMLTHPPSEMKVILQDDPQTSPQVETSVLWVAKAPTRPSGQGNSPSGHGNSQNFPPHLPLHISLLSSAKQPFWPERGSTPHPCLGAPRTTASSGADQIHASYHQAVGAHPISLAAAALVISPQKYKQVQVQTPKDVKYLSFVLDGRLEPPGSREEWVQRMIEQLTLQAVEEEQRRLSDNHCPRPCIEDITTIGAHPINTAEQEGRDARLQCNGEPDKGVQVSCDGKSVMQSSTLISSSGEGRAFGQVREPTITKTEQPETPTYEFAGPEPSTPSSTASMGERNALPPLPPAEGKGGG